jgi:hypothetical protein
VFEGDPFVRAEVPGRRHALGAATLNQGASAETKAASRRCTRTLDAAMFALISDIKTPLSVFPAAQLTTNAQHA